MPKVKTMNFIYHTCLKKIITAPPSIAQRKDLCKFKTMSEYILVCEHWTLHGRCAVKYRRQLFDAISVDVQKYTVQDTNRDNKAGADMSPPSGSLLESGPAQAWTGGPVRHGGAPWGSEICPRQTAATWYMLVGNRSQVATASFCFSRQETSDLSQTGKQTADCRWRTWYSSNNQTCYQIAMQPGKPILHGGIFHSAIKQ